MTPGHFGLAAGAKKWAPRLPLWSLFLSTYLLDVLFLLFLAAGLESFSPLDPSRPNAYGGVLIQAYYTHSLVGALLVAGIAGWLAGRRWGGNSGVATAGVVFSHWILDLLVHRPDLPVFPGNLGNLPLMGFGLWQIPLASAVIETVLVLGGAILYYRSAVRLPAAAGESVESKRRRALTASLVTGGLLALLLVSNLMGI